MAYGLLSRLLMGSSQTLTPGSGVLQSLLQPMSSGFQLPPGAQPSGDTYPDHPDYPDLGGGTLPGAKYPPAPSAAQPASSSALSDFLSPEIALPMAGALMAGPTFGEGMGKALAYGGAQLGAVRDKNKTKAYLAANFPDLAALSDAGAPTDVLWKAALLKKGIGKDGVSYSTPTEVVKPDGTKAWVMYGNDATMKELSNPSGLQPGKAVWRMMGDHWGLLDSAGNEIGSKPIENYQASSDKAEGGKVGAGKGDAKVAYQSMAAKMPGLESTVKQLDDLSGKATYTWTGTLNDTIRRQMGAEPRDSAIARQQYISMVDNQILPLLRDTFGAQFTEREGETLRATLGNPDLHPKEKQAVLKAFIEQKRRNMAADAKQAGLDVPDYVPPPGAIGTDAPASAGGGGSEETWVRDPATGQLKRQ